MTDKINGHAFAGQFLTGSLNFYTIRTSLDIRSTGVLTDASQDRLDKLVETISLRAQPVFMGAIATTVETSPSDLPGSTGSTTVYSISFAIEHNQAWEVSGSANPTLAESLDGVAGFVYDIADTANNNVAVVLTAALTK